MRLLADPARFDRRSFQHGMPVHDASGRRVGYIDLCGATELYLREKRRSARSGRSAVSYDQVERIHRGEVYLREGAGRPRHLPSRRLPEGVLTATLPFYVEPLSAG